MSQESSPVALQPGYELHWYRIDKVLGQGAFGITYLAHDINLDRQVAIKEYLPGQFSVRVKDLTVQPTTAEQQEDFEWGLKRFISEARTLTKFEHPNLVRVFNVFEMNGTAYMVMNYELGKSLQQILKSRKTLSESEMIKILIPLMSGLEIMHSKGFVHRDIKPGNIYIRGDGSPVLLDFGSARQTRAGRDGTDNPQTLTTLVSPGYAPIEQYGSKSDRQGPWTDIYGLAATVFKSIAGVMPISAIDRNESILHDDKDPYPPLARALKDKYTESFLNAIDHAMAFRANERPQCIADWRKEFRFNENTNVTITDPEGDTEKIEAATVKLKQDEPATVKTVNREAIETQKPEPTDDTGTIKTVKEKPPGTSGKYLIAGVVLGVILLAGIGVMFMGGETETGPSAPVASEPPAPVAPEPLVITEEETPAGISDSEVEAVEAVEAVEEVAEPPEQDAQTQQQVMQLLEQAQADIKALRLTSPKDNNAFDKYLAVLKLDAGNEDAQAGIRSISDKYIALAYGAMNKNNLDQAKAYLNKASVISPDTEKIAKAEQALQKKRTEQVSLPKPTEGTSDAPRAASTETGEEPNESFWEKVKKWHEEGVEERKQYDTREKDAQDAQIRDAL